MHVRLNYVVLIAAVIAAPIAIGLSLSPASSAGSFVTSLAALLALALLLPQEWQRDRRAAAVFLFGVSFVVMTSAGTSWVIGDERKTVALAVGLIALLSTVAFGVFWWREYRFVDLLPSWLDGTFPEASMFEEDGVQWAFGRGVGPDEAPDVQFHLQNNVDAARTVELRLLEESGVLSRSGALLLPAPFAVELPPRAHATVTLPLAWAPLHKAKKVQLYFFVDARGAAAPRNRRQRGPRGPRPTSKWIVVLGPLAGHFTLQRGGIHLVLQRPAQPAPPAGPLQGRLELLERPALVPQYGARLTGVTPR